MSLYSVAFSTFNRLLLPHKKRKAKILALFAVIAKPLQYLRDLLFDSYYDGFTGGVWANDPLLDYPKGTRVRYTDRAVYETILETVVSTVPCTDTTKWRKVQDLHIGLKNRIQWGAEKLLLERALYEWFVDFGAIWNYPLSLNSIYIVTNALDLGVFMVGENSDDTSNAVDINTNEDEYVMEGNYSDEIYSFTIYVPTALHTQLGSDTDERNGQIMAVADKLIYAGMKYNIITY